jgi:hypothetical protein
LLLIAPEGSVRYHNERRNVVCVWVFNVYSLSIGHTYRAVIMNTKGPLMLATCCNSVIQSQHRHDFVRCMCGQSFVDGGNSYLRCGGDVRVLELEDVDKLLHDAYEKGYDVGGR